MCELKCADCKKFIRLAVMKSYPAGIYNAGRISKFGDNDKLTCSRQARGNSTYLKEDHVCENPAEFKLSETAKDA